jgi:hypothetical protein
MNPYPVAKKVAPVNTILFAWIVAGTLDLFSACVAAYLRNHVLPANILKYIASAIFGSEAFAGGAEMIAAGTVMHYMIALTWTTLFFFLYPRLKLYSYNKFLVAIGYGIFVWITMNLVAVPLTKIPNAPFSVAGVLIGESILIVAIGLPLSLIAHQYYKGRE